VPVYQPSVVYSQPPAYGVSPYISFGIGLPVGIWLNHDWDWRDHRLIVWNRDHFRPRDWWYRPARERFSPGVVHNEFHDWRLRQHGVSSNNRVEDRGWGSRPRQSTPVRIPETQPRRTEPFHSAEPERRANPPAQPARPEPRREQPPMNGAPPPRSTTTTRAPWSAAAPQPNGALVGAHSAREARDYSNRGQQSRQIGAVPSRGGIGGGGPTRSFGGRNQQRH
jgi:hypothetical protein